MTGKSGWNVKDKAAFIDFQYKELDELNPPANGCTRTKSVIKSKPINQTLIYMM